MNITVVGAGYVGLVTGACFAELGNHVTLVDVDEKKVANLKQGVMPIYELGLEVMVTSNVKANRLKFTASMADAVKNVDVFFIAVNTPSDLDGAADTQHVINAAKVLGEHIEKSCVIVEKSTVPVGMSELVRQQIQQGIEARKLALHFEVVSNPEFLREGAAIEDFMKPDRVIIGLSSDRARNIMLDLYMPLVRNPERIFFMSVKDAEMTKYAANAMLATRISFMNGLALLCERMGVDIENVRLGIGSDSRIGSAFLNAGCGYGGSCLPKDVRALINMAEAHGMEPLLLHAVEKRNMRQKQILAQRLTAILGDDLAGIAIGLWGLAFKPGTDDMREAPSLSFIEHVVQKGGVIKAFDPQAMSIAEQLLPKEWVNAGKVVFVDDQYEALSRVDALVLVTEWQSFCYPDIAIMKEKMRRHIILDGRNQYDPKTMRDAGFDYFGVGR